MSCFTKKAIFDFDGTVVNVWKRYYHVFFDYISKNYKYLQISEHEYQINKTSGVKDHTILENHGIDNFDVSSYVNYRRKALEEKKYLKLDVINDGFFMLIRFLKKEGYLLELATIRRNSKNLYWELEQLGINDIFDKVLVFKPENSVKAIYYENQTNPNDIIIGDSVKDMLIGISENKKFFITTGLEGSLINKKNGDICCLDSLEKIIEHLI